MSLDSPMASRVRPGAVDAPSSSGSLAAGSCNADEELLHLHDLLSSSPLCGEVAALSRWVETLNGPERTAVACFFAERCPQGHAAVVESALRTPRHSHGDSDGARPGAAAAAAATAAAHRRDFFEHFQRAVGEHRGAGVVSAAGAPGEHVAAVGASSAGAVVSGSAGSAAAGLAPGAVPGVSRGSQAGARSHYHHRLGAAKDSTPGKSPFSTIQPFISTVGSSTDMYAHAFAGFPSSSSAAAAAAAVAAAPSPRQFTPWSLRQDLGRPKAVVSPGPEAAPSSAGSPVGSLGVSASQKFSSYQMQAPSTWTNSAATGPVGMPLESGPWATSMRRHTHGEPSVSATSPFRSISRASSGSAMGSAAPGSAGAPVGGADTVPTGTSDFLPMSAPPISGSAPGAGRSTTLPSSLAGQVPLGSAKRPSARAPGAGVPMQQQQQKQQQQKEQQQHDHSASPSPRWAGPNSAHREPGSSTGNAGAVGSGSSVAASLLGSSVSTVSPVTAPIGSGANVGSPVVANSLHSTTASLDSAGSSSIGVGGRGRVGMASGPNSIGRGSFNADFSSPDSHKDVGSWLRSLRLHKYTENLSGLTWQEVVALTESDLEKRGVSALGARRKMLKMFEQVREANNHDT